MVKLLVIGTLLISTVAISGQAAAQPTPDRQQEESLRTRETFSRRQMRDDSAARLRAVSDNRPGATAGSRIAIANINGLYREPTKKELRKLSPADEDNRKYADFLKGRNTGIVRLEPYSGCGDSTKVISADENCLKYTLPGGGSDYSFRKSNYRISRLADLRYGSDVFSSPGVLLQSIFVGLGDVPLEKVGPASPGMKYLYEIDPPTKLSDALALDETLSRGVEKDGFYYAQEMKAVDGMTYVLRSIAYRGKVYRSMGGVVYNEMDLDDRADVTVAFRIVRRNENGGITILWKELERKEAPVLERDKTKTVESSRQPFAAGEHF